MEDRYQTRIPPEQKLRTTEHRYVSVQYRTSTIIHHLVLTEASNTKLIRCMSWISWVAIVYSANYHYHRLTVQGSWSGEHHCVLRKVRPHYV